MAQAALQTLVPAARAVLLAVAACGFAGDAVAAGTTPRDGHVFYRRFRGADEVTSGEHGGGSGSSSGGGGGSGSDTRGTSSSGPSDRSGGPTISSHEAGSSGGGQAGSTASAGQPGTGVSHAPAATRSNDGGDRFQ